MGFRTEGCLCNLRNLRIVSGYFRLFRDSLSGPRPEEPFNKGENPSPEEPDGEEAAQQAADEKLRDVTAGARVKVGVCGLQENWRYQCR